MTDRQPAAEIRHRLRRYAMLRAAERAITSCGRFHRCLATSERACEVLAELRSGLEHLSVDSPALEGDLTAVDQRLASYSQVLLAILQETSISSFRAMMPTMLVVDLDQVVGLLDLCLECQATALAHSDLIAYVVTSLSTRTENGLQTVVSDPVKATPRLSALCTAVERQLSSPGLDFEGEIRGVTESMIDLADLDAAVIRVRAIKTKLGFRVFLPPVLRALVDYNVTIGNRLQALLDQERVMDKEFLSGLGA